MADTKERILMTALHLFAKDGYETVSVSAIAGELGITKGALYKHYRNKRDIFDSILERMYQIDLARAKEYEMPEEKYEAEPNAYKNISFNSIKAFTVSQYRFWTQDAFASDFRKMLTLEQYRSPEMAQWYKNCLTAGPVAYMADIFREMTENGILKQADPEQLAVEFYAPLFLMIAVSDGRNDRENAVERLSRHIDRFIRENSADDSARG